MIMSHWRHCTSPTEIHHLSLEELLSVLHDIKVSQVQVDVVAVSTLCRGHVPHHHEGSVLQDRTCRGHSRPGVMVEGKGGSEEEEEKVERTVRQHHGHPASEVSFLTGERNGLVRFTDEELFCTGIQTDQFINWKQNKHKSIEYLFKFSLFS